MNCFKSAMRLSIGEKNARDGDNGFGLEAPEIDPPLTRGPTPLRETPAAPVRNPAIAGAVGAVIAVTLSRKSVRGVTIGFGNLASNNAACPSPGTYKPQKSARSTKKNGPSEHFPASPPSSC